MNISIQTESTPVAIGESERVFSIIFSSLCSDFYCYPFSPLLATRRPGASLASRRSWGGGRKNISPSARSKKIRMVRETNQGRGLSHASFPYTLYRRLPCRHRRQRQSCTRSSCGRLQNSPGLPTSSTRPRTPSCFTGSAARRTRGC